MANTLNPLSPGSHLSTTLLGFALGVLGVCNDQKKHLQAQTDRCFLVNAVPTLKPQAKTSYSDMKMMDSLGLLTQLNRARQSLRLTSCTRGRSENTINTYIITMKLT